MSYSLVIDPICSDNICAGSDNITERNFSHKTNDNYLSIYFIIFLIIILEYLMIVVIDSFCNKKKEFIIK